MHRDYSIFMASETLARLKTLGMQAMLPMELLAFAVSKDDEEVDRWLGVSREMMLAGRKLRKFADISSDELEKSFDLDPATAKRRGRSRVHQYHGGGEDHRDDFAGEPLSSALLPTHQGGPA